MLLTLNILAKKQLMTKSNGDKLPSGQTSQPCSNIRMH